MPNAAERAYLGVRARILDGTFPPGTPLREEMLAGEIGVSRTPIRDALRRLLADGLVESTRNHGTFVAGLAPEELREIFELRILLESHAARKAAPRITPEEIAGMEALAAAMEAIEAPDETGVAAFSDLNARFHLLLAHAARSPRLEGILLRTLQAPLVLLKEYRLHERVGIPRSNRQHREIIAALRAGNAEWAALAVSAHIVSTIPDFAGVGAP